MGKMKKMRKRRRVEPTKTIATATTDAGAVLRVRTNTSIGPHRLTDVLECMKDPANPTPQNSWTHPITEITARYMLNHISLVELHRLGKLDEVSEMRLPDTIEHAPTGDYEYVVSYGAPADPVRTWVALHADGHIQLGVGKSLETVQGPQVTQSELQGAGHVLNAYLDYLEGRKKRLN